MLIRLLAVGGLLMAVPAGPALADDAAARVPARQFAPYLETSAPHVDHLAQAIDGHGLTAVTVAFVLGRGCTPVWDDGTPVAGNRAAAALVASAKAKGARVVLSFGGASGTELARSCTDQGALTAAYRSVISRFGVTQVDFDVEGVALGADAANTRRFAAIRALQQKTPALDVSFTLPVGTRGLLSDGVAFLRKSRSAGVRPDLVNVMAMDYGQGVRDMGGAAVTAAQGTLAQLRRLWPAATYADIGITPMLGQNDTADEVFTYDDAQTVAAFARSRGVGRLAFWSLNRDSACTTSGGPAQNGCSGLPQSPLDYTDAFVEYQG